LGQCGGNIANEFGRFGYNVIALNTSTTDLKDLDGVPEENRLHIGLEGRNGAGKDRRLGLQSLLAHREKILERVKDVSKGADVIMLTAGMGGGTGSNMGELVTLLQPIGLPVACMATIPTDTESGLTKVNAVNGIGTLTRSKLANLIIVDNEKILKIFPDASISDFYKRANQLVVRTMVEFNSTAHETKSVSLRSFDSEDFRKVFLSGGVVVFGASAIKSEGAINGEAVFTRLRQIWDSSGLLAEGIDYESAALAAVVFFAPQHVLERSSANIVEKLNDTIKRHTKGAAVYTGIYQLKEPGPVRMFTMLGRLSLPERMGSLMNQAVAEGRNLAQKVKKKMPTLDMSEVESIDQFFDEEPAFDDKLAISDRTASLINSLNDPDKEVRKGAVIKLGERGDPASSSAVISLLNDPDDDVRMEAARALRLLGNSRQADAAGTA